MGRHDTLIISLYILLSYITKLIITKLIITRLIITELIITKLIITKLNITKLNITKLIPMTGNVKFSYSELHSDFRAPEGPAGNPALLCAHRATVLSS